MMSKTVSLNEVFVSYAHIDNVPARGVRHGWASNLHYDLENALARQLGGHCRVWLDQSELRGNAAVSPEIASKLAQATALVIILSRAFLSSEWCLRELAIFQERLSPSSISGQVFVVDIAGINRDELETVGLSDLSTYRFWYPDEQRRVRTYGSPEPRSEEPEYYRLVDDLATDIADTLKKTQAYVKGNERAAKALNLVDAKAAPGNLRKPVRPIILAEVTDDLDPLRQQLRRYVEQAGFAVLLSESFGKSAEAFKTEFHQQLEQSALFVQLLSQVPGRTRQELPEGCAKWQYQCAVDWRIRIMQWRDPTVPPSQVHDAVQQALLSSENVYALPFETFKRLVTEAIIEVPEHSRTPRDSASVFINADKRDLPLAQQIGTYMGKDAAVFLPVESADPAEIRQNLEENMVSCDGLLVVYGDGSAAWVQQQLRLYNKLVPRRDRPIKLLAVIEAPPEGKPSINAQIPGMRVLNFRSGIDHTAIMKALEGLSDGWRQ